MAYLIDNLRNSGVLICPACGTGPLDAAETGIRCPHCGVLWPARNGVVDFYNRYLECGDGDQGEADARYHAFAAKLIRVLDLPDTPAMADRVGEIISRSLSLKSDNISVSAEINDLEDRFFGNDAAIIQPEPDAAANTSPQIVFERHYFPANAQPGTQLSANIRLRNAGAFPLSSRTAHGIVLAGRWLAAGQPARAAGPSARFPIDLVPGRSISLPVTVEIPDRPGPHVLRIGLAMDGGDEFVGDTLDIPVEARGGPRGILRRLGAAFAPPRPSVAVELCPPNPSYGEDHAFGVDTLKTCLAELGKARYRLLEVGTGTHPQTAWLENCEVVALDISAPMLELGSLYFGDRFAERLAFICADAFAPPFKPGAFDVVVMFSALHHFPEPEAVLQKLSALLAPGGVLAVMCEPVSNTLESACIIRDLLKGINEQVFSLDEYRLIFARAGLTPMRLRLAGASLVALLSLAGPVHSAR